ncbi:MAG: hypothetical protein US96_C0055G0002 [Candidatus Woesebacteria bacterium GW2011_GWB1_38_5b]|uniref:Uncharacterized protein n=1 Tax=Candidatus Woesebacteria bacterium GW2011_GWB1_38_5b TaxID=1618569 RepID=A0A0G0K1W4_9BACT|nr:MAG: hypothetical protein US96_C0055G0002 [Candidatus Woesebacteria bacterium GW2011_GWB1_38_5b]
MKLNGYRPTHKNKWFFIKYGILNIQELALLEYYADIFDFDKNHRTFGLFEINFEEIASIFSCKSANTVRNWHNKLLKLGFIRKTELKYVYELSCHLRYINPGKWGGQAVHFQEIEKDQPIEVILQSFGINLQSIGKKIQPVGKNSQNLGSKPTPIALGSSKDGIYSSDKKYVLVKQGLRSNEEYVRLKEEMGLNSLEIDDMKWIDENLISRQVVTNDNEGEIVSLFFNGSYEHFHRNLITLK